MASNSEPDETRAAQAAKFACAFPIALVAMIVNGIILATCIGSLKWHALHGPSIYVESYRLLAISI